MQEVGQTQDSEYKYTIAKWLTPNGTWINQKGLKPTYPVPESSFSQTTSIPKYEYFEEINDWC